MLICWLSIQIILLYSVALQTLSFPTGVYRRPRSEISEKDMRALNSNWQKLAICYSRWRGCWQPQPHWDAVSYSMAWQRRNGDHNSNTSQGAVMGTRTGKVLDYRLQAETYKTCTTSKNIKHDCRKNHAGFSKSMEPPDVAVDHFQRAMKNGVKYN